MVAVSKKKTIKGPKGKTLKLYNKNGKIKSGAKSLMDIVSTKAERLKDLKDEDDYAHSLQLKASYAKFFDRANINGGRPKAFEHPAELQKAAIEYFEWVNENPWYREEYKGSGEFGGKVQMRTARPYTWGGLCITLGVGEKYFNIFRAQLKKTDPFHDEFNNVIEQIDSVIRTQKFEGAMVGAFSTTLTAYDLGYKKDVAMAGANSPTVNIIMGGGDPAHQDALNQILERLRTIDAEAEVMNSKPLTP
jgi:hypothetical protein